MINMESEGSLSQVKITEFLSVDGCSNHPSSHQQLKKSPPIRQLLSNEANFMLKKWHYLGNVHGVIYAWGHEEGCLVFTNSRSRLYEKNMNLKGLKIIELARMVGKPNHNWAMSSLMRLCIIQLKKLNKYDLIVTYSDPFAGHNGKVYNSANFIFDKIIVYHGQVGIDRTEGSYRWGEQVLIAMWMKGFPKIESRCDQKGYSRIQVAMPKEEAIKMFREALNELERESKTSLIHYLGVKNQ